MLGLVNVLQDPLNVAVLLYLDNINYFICGGLTIINQDLTHQFDSFLGTYSFNFAHIVTAHQYAQIHELFLTYVQPKENTKMRIVHILHLKMINNSPLENTV